MIFAVKFSSGVWQGKRQYFGAANAGVFEKPACTSLRASIGYVVCAKNFWGLISASSFLTVAQPAGLCRSYGLILF